MRAVGGDVHTFFLNNAPQNTFSSLQDLVTFYSSPRSELKFPLQPILVEAEAERSRTASRRRSSHQQSVQRKPSLMRRSSSKKLLDPSSTSPEGGFVRRKSTRASIARSTGERLDQRAVTSNWCCLNLTKEEALARLPKKEGAFIVRRSDGYFATLSMVVNGKHFHSHIEDTTQGLRLKKSSVYQPNLSALVAYYKIPNQTDLPRTLVVW